MQRLRRKLLAREPMLCGTYAGLGWIYQLCADTQCQVYMGLSGAVPNTDVAATRGQVLTYQNQLVDALYSSTTGGITAAFSDVWNGADRPICNR